MAPSTLQIKAPPRIPLKTCSIHVGIPKLGAGPAGSMRWHAFQRNTIGGLMEAAGFGEQSYAFHGNGHGATIVYATPRIDVRVGQIPEHVQTYLDQITIELDDVLRTALGLAKSLLAVITPLVPDGPVLAGIATAISVGEQVADEIGVLTEFDEG